MKTRQLITLFMLLFCFTVFREIERKIWEKTEVVVDRVATSFEFGETEKHQSSTTALLTTQGKNK